MKMQAFSVFDEKGGFYGSPFFCVAPGQAVRMFEDLVKDANSTVSKHPGDYKLYHIGSYDDASAELASIVPPVYLGCGSDFLVQDAKGLKVSRA